MYPKMSSSQKRIAEYLLQNYDKAVFLTAKELGQTLDVSESTVIRFANFLEYNGYPELLKSLQDMVKNRITTVERMQSSLLKKETNVLNQMLAADITNIKLTMEKANADFNEAVQAIVQARNIYIISLRSTTALGYFLYFYLQLILKNCRLINGSGLFFEELHTAGPQDLIIAISFPRYTRQTVEGARYAKENGANVLAITDAITSPLAQFSDFTLTAHSEQVSFIDTFVAPLSLLNALIIAVGNQTTEATAQILSQLEDAWRRHEIYYSE
jgi:DNA-binding MurR/RpiR family transcriptional regulator